MSKVLVDTKALKMNYRKLNRSILICTLIVCFTCLFAVNNVQGQFIRVTLLGTGSPLPVMERFGPSILVEAGDQKFLFDAGRGVLQRLRQADVKYKDIQ